MQKILIASLISFFLCPAISFAETYQNTVEFPGVVKDSPTTETSITPHEDLKSWLADCKRRIKRKWEEKKSLNHVKCSFQLSHAGNVKNLKVVKGRKQGPIAAEVLESASSFRKAPNNLPYEKSLVLEFKEFPELDLRVK